MPNNEVYYLTEQEVADKLKKSIETIRKWRQEERGPKYYRVERGILYDAHAVQDYISGNQVLGEIKRNPEQYMADVRVGKELDNFLDDNASYEYSRHQLPNIIKYLDTDKSSSVCILQGLRRTGKSVLMLQAIQHLAISGNFDKTVYIRCYRSDSMAKLSETLNFLQKNNYKYIFLDEATLIPRITDRAASLPDIHARGGMRIVVAGTDSLLLSFVKQYEWFGRSITYKTTNVRFFEHVSITGNNEIESYLEHGGIFKDGEGDAIPDDYGNFDSPKNADEYCRSAIAMNIQHALEWETQEERFGPLVTLYNEGVLASAIMTVVSDINNRFIADILFNQYDNILASLFVRGASHAAKSVEKQEKLKNFLERKNLYQDFFDDMGVESPMKTGEKIKITQTHVNKIIKYLGEISLFSKYNEIRCDSDGLINNEPIERQYMVLPGMRYQQAKSFLKTIMRHPDFIKLNLPMQEQNEFFKIAMSLVRGRLLEDCIMFEVMESIRKIDPYGEKFETFKYGWSCSDNTRGEFDLVIRNIEENCCAIYEIKSTAKYRSEYGKHLVNMEQVKRFEKHCGKVVDRCVLFQGAGHPHGENTGRLRSKNISEFLLELENAFPAPGLKKTDDEDEVTSPSQ